MCLLRSSSNYHTIRSISFLLILDPSRLRTIPTSNSVKYLPPWEAAKKEKTFRRYFSSVVLI